MIKEIVVVDGVRTAIGKAGEGSYFANVRADELSAICIRELVKRTGVDPHTIEDVIWGLSTAHGEQGYDIGRVSGILAGLPLTVPGIQVNRFCASGLVAIQIAASTIACGWGDCMIAGGVEHMTRFPTKVVKFHHPKLADYIDMRGLIVGHDAEVIARELNVSREAMDEYSMISQHRAAKATAEGKFKREIIPIEVEVKQKDGTTKRMIADKDQGIRGETSMEGLAKLKALFADDDLASVTAGNSAQVNDAAAAVLVMDGEKAREAGLKPRLRLISYAAVAMDPTHTMWGPIYAIPKVLNRAGMKKEDIDVWEINEAFASQSVATMRELDLPLERMNMWGSGVSLGHPLGCTGARMVVTLMNIMDEVDGRYGVVSMCAASGQGGAAIFERIV